MKCSFQALYNRPLPKSPFLTLLLRLLKHYFEDGVGRTGAELAYYLLFSFFPFLVFLNGLIGLLNVSPTQIVELLDGLLPPDVVEIVAQYFVHLSQTSNISFLAFGVFFTIYFSMRTVNSLRHALNLAHNLDRQPATPRVWFTSLFCTVLVMLLVGLTLLILVCGKSLLMTLQTVLPIPVNLVELWNYLRFFLIAAVSFVLLSILYRVLPNQKLSFRQVVPGTLGALISWTAVSFGFSFYVENMGRYPVIYGSLGAVIVLLLWLYLIGVILVMGGQLNYVVSLSKKEAAAKKADGAAPRDPSPGT